MFWIIEDFIELFTSELFAIFMGATLPLCLMFIIADTAMDELDADYCDAVNGYDARHFARS